MQIIFSQPRKISIFEGERKNQQVNERQRTQNTHIPLFELVEISQKLMRWCR